MVPCRRTAVVFCAWVSSVRRQRWLPPEWHAAGVTNAAILACLAAVRRCFRSAASLPHPARVGWRSRRSCPAAALVMAILPHRGDRPAARAALPLSYSFLVLFLFSFPFERKKKKYGCDESCARGRSPQPLRHIRPARGVSRSTGLGAPPMRRDLAARLCSGDPFGAGQVCGVRLKPVDDR